MVRLYGVIGTKQFLTKWSANEEELGFCKGNVQKAWHFAHCAPSYQMSPCNSTFRFSSRRMHERVPLKVL
ncbi:hypothetical protein Y032_0102g3453 [Ancylostoma ceylanicum]|uniref:Uncharacterized protein n=1 Tax=Ancylostoma ceylanicum TaxID=53326 RepID=A0A016THE8_9BILA|nr:hypothetical protein Y032_0102g3453 [Ancylostoma ceylanicum]